MLCVAFGVMVPIHRPIDAQTQGRIAYASDEDGDWDIYVINPDGTGRKALTANAVEDREPAWSPDGRTLAYISRQDGDVEVYCVNADGTGRRRLTRNPGVDHSPVWSPNGKQIAFVSPRGSQTDIYVVGADGTGLAAVATHPADDFRPSWVSNTEIVFLSARKSGNSDAAGEMFRALVAGGEARPVLKENRKVTWVAASRQAPFRIAFSMVGTRRNEIGVVNLDGTNEQNLSLPAKSETDSQPIWSPDGRQLAFHADRSGAGVMSMHAMLADGSGAVRLSDAGQPTQGPPTWSPDNRQVAYAAFTKGNWDLYVADAAGGRSRALTTTAAAEMGPVWAPVPAR